MNRYRCLSVALLMFAGHAVAQVGSPAAAPAAGIQGVPQGPGRGPLPPVVTGPSAPVPPEVAIPRPTPEELAKVPQAPDSLQGAIAALEADHEFLLKGDVFTEDFVENWIDMKRKECDSLRLRPHPYEFAMYYDV